MSAPAIAGGELLGLLAQNYDGSLLYPVGPYPELAIDVEQTDVDAVIGEVARLLSLRLEKHGELLFLIPNGHRPPDPALLALAAGDLENMDLKVAGASGSQALALAHSLQPLPRTAPCAPGPPISLRLEDVSPGELLAAVAFVSGLELVSRTEASPTCLAPDWSQRRLDAERATLIATAGVDDDQGGTTAALIRERDAVGRLTESERITVGEEYVSVGASDTVYLELPTARLEAPSPDLVAADRFPRLRLAATVIRGEARQALFETPSGELFICQPGETRSEPGRLVLDPGRLQIEPGRAILDGAALQLTRAAERRRAPSRRSPPTADRAGAEPKNVRADHHCRDAMICSFLFTSDSA